MVSKTSEALYQFTGGEGGHKIEQNITFSNDTGTVTVFTVTGDVNVKIIPIIKTSLTSAAAANIRLGVVGSTDAMIVDSVATDLVADKFWNDQTPTNEVESDERRRNYDISNGNDVILTLDAQIDTGVIRFYCIWSALSADGKVEVA